MNEVMVGRHKTPHHMILTDYQGNCQLKMLQQPGRHPQKGVAVIWNALMMIDVSSSDI